jgi:hypothetical protein
MAAQSCRRSTAHPLLRVSAPAFTVTDRRNGAISDCFLNKKADCGWPPIANRQRRTFKPPGPV